MAFVVRTRLDTIAEESECSRSSSQVSITKNRQRKEALSFSNKSALEDLENESQITGPMLPDLPDEVGGSDLAFVNKSALDLERGKATEAALSGIAAGLAERGATITTSFRKVVAMRNIGDARKGDLQPNDSPLTRYSPCGITISPDDVKGNQK